jgi:hypothetical protein
MKSVISFVALFLTMLGGAAAQQGLMKSEFIYETAPFPSCHASTIVETQGDQLVAAWFGGTHEKASDVGIWVSRCEGGRWIAPVEVANGVQADGSRHPCGRNGLDPIIVESCADPRNRVSSAPRNECGEHRSWHEFIIPYSYLRE